MKRLVSGMRPTGPIHLGNYWGTLKKWIELQDEYECFFEVADLHTLTTGFENTKSLYDNSRDMVLDWLAAGLDPNKCYIFKQSDIAQHCELATLLAMITPLSWLENNPTYKELTDLNLGTYGFLGYPVLQAADILLYQPDVVLVGKDQLPHIELTREIARRFNSLYGNTFKEPTSLLTSIPKLQGIDGRKMSKSYNNSINLNEPTDDLKAKLMQSCTDITKIKASDPGHPEPCMENPLGCSIFAYHKLYNPNVAQRKLECEKGSIGCVGCKKDLFNLMEPSFIEFQERRKALVNKDKWIVERILANSREKVKQEAQNVLVEVKKAMLIL